ncbi:HIT domain-containing protein, putative [Phytophthora infestans T30-4]|uniref:HIT domain-containing protein, putative n=2 Tax=Phytophthora infestans TaxID=4787 RepID=D0NG52_PHYIT|nr:HIT domain-containing protein, putative [Phytophthora infestans T30-4]EEY57253.1 HIT domain-containing protein, putative [Phytophthora infestans T30-4]KAF4130180.1 HIT domain-containing protein [Phytophthora infestans]|eukprot:XP_002901863.1 HIT domain-containing protein, putative [Phytophthora infestans T30-4]
MAPIAYDPENIFAKIIKGDIPCYKLFETEHVLAILDAFPVAPGHALLIPKALGFATVTDMTPEVAANLFKELPRLAKAVQAATGADGLNIIQNNGAASGQAVFHAHIHVIPRFDKDGLITLPNGPSMINKEDGEAMQTKIQTKL